MEPTPAAPAVTLDSGSLKSREFWLACGTLIVVFILASLFFWLGRLTADQWISLVEWVSTTMIGFFGGYKTIQKAIVAWSNKGATTVPAVPAQPNEET